MRVAEKRGVRGLVNSFPCVCTKPCVHGSCSGTGHQAVHGRAMRLKLAWPLRGMHGDCNGGHAAVEWALRHAWGL